MKDATISIVRRAYQAYVDTDRAAIEALIGDDFHFTSPRDNRINREVYFDKCWKTATQSPASPSSIWSPMGSACS
jgi:hypothetical protein